MKAKYDISVLDDDTIRDRFEEAFISQMEDGSNELAIGEVDVEVERDQQTNDLNIRVTVFAMAEHTPRFEFHNPSTGEIAKGAKTIKIDAEEKGVATFLLTHSMDRNTNDYDVVYTLQR